MKIIVLYSSEAQQGIINSLIDLGHTVTPFYYGLGKLNIIKRQFIKSTGQQWDAITALFNAEIKRAYDHQVQNPQELILFIKGHSIQDDTIKLLQRIKSRKIQWTIDSLVRFPGQKSLFPYMDKVFVQDGSDVNLHPNAQWLPLGFDEILFQYNSKKDIDILLLGNLLQPLYSNRKKCMFNLAHFATKGYNVCFAGYQADSDLLMFFKRCGVKTLGRLPLNKYAKYISRSKICVNMHQDDGGKAINPMFFAIPATGGIQLTDNSPYLEEWLQPFRHYYPTSADTIAQDITPLISKECISKEIANEALVNHSYKSRAKILIS